MRKPIIKKGNKFGKLTAIEFRYKSEKHYQFWLFKCECGNEKVICVSDAKRGKIKSCGCIRERGGNLKHGMFGTRIYRSWCSMKERILNPDNKSYKDYGGRGITICEEWLNFENFYRDMGEMPENKTLDRIKNNLGYCKSNCKWSTPLQQANNKRNNRLLTFKGKTQNVKQWAKELGIKYTTLQGRIKRGWTDERALNLIS